MTMNLSVTGLACAADAHYESGDGRLRCSGVKHRLRLHWADSVVCPFCAAHFTPARGSAISHIRACAPRHGATWPL
jgi:uncharacterized Zn-finger protein